jgi:hypothetical protein
MPSLALGPGGNVHVGYYTQHDNEMIDVDLANSHDRAATFPANRKVRVTSEPFALGPSNVPVTSFFTYNPGFFDPCYQLGDYINVKSPNGKVYVLWADGRNSITHPLDPFDPLSGVTHPQVDVFFQALHPPF